MTNSDRTDESADMIVEPREGDAGDFDEVAATATADKQLDEVDDIAAGADPTGLGHGPDQPDHGGTAE